MRERERVKGFLKNRGFTLIELLVVISIIGFLATASMVVFNNVRVKARNNKRNQDIVQLMKAFALATDDAGGVIPLAAGAWVCVSSSCYGGWSTVPASATVDAAIGPYIKKPEDPANSSRGYGGYIFYNPIPSPGYGGQGAGAYIDWPLEPTANVPGVCGPGFVYFIYSSFIECMVKLAF